MLSYLIAGPALEPVSLDDARGFVRMDATDEDALLTALVAAARVHIESVTGRALFSQQWRIVLDGWPCEGRLPLPIAPALELLALRVHAEDGTTATLPTAGLLIDGDPARLLFPSDFDPGIALAERQAIEVDYRAGYGAAADDVPAPLRQAIRLLVGYWFENRDVANPAAAVSPAVDALLAPYRRVRL